MLSESDPALAVARHADAPPQARLRVQRAAHVASHPHRRGLRDGGHRHRRPGDHGRGPGLSLARGRDVRRTRHRSGGQPRAVRGAGRPDAEVLQRGVLQPPRQALRLPARGGVSRSPAHRDHVRAAAEASARRDLDAHREQQVDRLHGVEGLQGDGHPQRGEDPGRRHRGVPRCLREVRQGQAARRGRDLGGRPLSRGYARGGEAPRRALARRALQVVRALRLRPVRGRAGADVGHAGRASPRAVPRRRHRAEGVVLRTAGARHRGDQVDRGEVPGLEDFMVHWAEGSRPASSRSSFAGSRRT